MTPDLLAKFRSLVVQMEPENLHADGERSRADANRLHRRLQREWHTLERAAGRRVQDSEVWATFSA